MECVILASGSKGNCIYIKNETDSVIIDAGLGYIKRTLDNFHLRSDNLRAVCITHEHSDHTRSAKALIKAVSAPVIASGGTLYALVQNNIIPAYAKIIESREASPIEAGGLEITSFKTYHDAVEPCGFVIDDGDARIGVCLDTHKVSDKMFAVLSNCDAVVLESNYSTFAMKNDSFPKCLECRHCGAECLGDACVKRIYPRYLKDRIKNDGHLSNEVSSEVIAELSKDVGKIALAHLSENYNRPNVARTSAENAAAEGCEIYVSDQLPEYRERRLVRFTV
ncbi:MAG: MBL fold metallo-hydrolase [Methanocorpusculum sp.]|nr:MBL fold metallo-hydrolase [Methanocorpusculum sp.]